jgi:hypothetical protein
MTAGVFMFYFLKVKGIALLINKFYIMPEIRLRDVQPDLLKQLEIIQKDLKEKTATGAIEKLIKDYAGTREEISQLVKRNTELHKRLSFYVDRERNTTQLLKNYSKNLVQHSKEVERDIKKYGTK